MPHLFISHSSEDETAVERLTDAIERAGFRCWFYERDAKPGESYLEAVGRAITEVDVFVFVATVASIASFEVRKELQYSHKRKKRLLTVVFDRAAHQKLDQDPELGMILGTSVQITYENAEPTAVVDTIIDRLAEWNIPRQPHQHMTPEQPSSNKLRELNWISDGMQVQAELLPSFVFGTKAVDQFVRNNQHYFICANKGLGKTLLLRYKRFQTQTVQTAEGYQPDTTGLVLIPEDRPYLDQLSDVPTISLEKEQNFLADLRNSRRLWSFALRLSCVSHCKYVLDKVPKSFQKSLPKNLLEWITSTHVAPTQVYKHLLSLPYGELHKLLDIAENALDALYRAVQNGVRIFIDRVDESTSDLARQAWINMQAGCIEASWACMNANNHVKIYASIREEAYVNYESVTKPNLHSAVITIRYTKDELRRMLDSLAGIYEGAHDFYEFIGFKDVKNSHAGIVEDSFNYLHRHTLGRPRDLVIVCAELSLQGMAGQEQRFRETVKQVGSDLVSSSLFSEMSVFLECLRDAKSRQRFFHKIPYNVLSRNELVEISSAFNEIDPSMYGELDTSGNIFSHPFCELWSCGLLGVVQRDNPFDAPTQRFKQRYDRAENCSHALPSADYYLIHPSLQTIIHLSRDGLGYGVFRGIVVGHGNDWLPHYQLIVRFQRALMRIPDNKVRQNAYLLLPFILESMNPDREVQGFIKETLASDVQSLLVTLESRNFEEAFFALSEILEFASARN